MFSYAGLKTPHRLKSQRAQRHHVRLNPNLVYINTAHDIILSRQRITVHAHTAPPRPPPPTAWLSKVYHISIQRSRRERTFDRSIRSIHKARLRANSCPRQSDVKKNIIMQVATNRATEFQNVATVSPASRAPMTYAHSPKSYFKSGALRSDGRARAKSGVQETARGVGPLNDRECMQRSIWSTLTGLHWNSTIPHPRLLFIYSFGKFERIGRRWNAAHHFRELRTKTPRPRLAAKVHILGLSGLSKKKKKKKKKLPPCESGTIIRGTDRTT
jgi:hypothetical protein